MVFSSQYFYDMEKYGPYFHMRSTEMHAWEHVGSLGIPVPAFQTQFNILIINSSSSLPNDTFLKSILSAKDHLLT